MTREEAIIYLKRADVTVGREPKTKTAEALEMAIKALEQEPILDELRDKIQAIYIGNRNGYGIMADVLKIIDKYRTECEE